MEKESSTVVSAESAVVKCLNFSNFGLKSVHDEVYIPTLTLEELNISDNEIENINFSSTSLRKLDCRNNQFSDIKFVNQFPNLEELSVSGNTFTLADHYIAATLCPKLKFIDGEPLSFNTDDINNKYERQLWPHILHVWNTKCQKHYSPELTNAKLESLIQTFVKQVKSKKLYTVEGFERFRDFKIDVLVAKFLDELKSSNSRHLPSRTFTISSVYKEEESEEIRMYSGTRSRSTHSSSMRKLNSTKHEKFCQSDSQHLTGVRTLRGKSKAIKEAQERKNKAAKEAQEKKTKAAKEVQERKTKVAKEALERNNKGAKAAGRKKKCTCNFGDIWPSPARRGKVDDVETMVEPSTCLSEAKFHKKKIIYPKTKKEKCIEEDEESFSSQDDASSNAGEDCSDSDISLMTATERALNFIQSPARNPRAKQTEVFHTRSASRHSGQSRSRTPVLPKYNLRKRKDDEDPKLHLKRSKIPTRKSSSSNRMKMRVSTQLSPLNKSRDHKARSDKASSRKTTQMSIRSSRTLRNEIAVFNDIENWCEDIGEHFLPDEQIQPDVAKSLAVPVESHSRMKSTSKTSRLKKTFKKSIPIASKASLEKSHSRKTIASSKKPKKPRRKLAPLIVSGDEESMDLDPSVNPNTIKSKFVERSESESSENLELDSSRSTWKKNDSESDFSCSPYEDPESDTEDEIPVFSKPSRRSERLESKERASTSSRKSSRINSKLSVKSDDFSTIRKPDRETRDKRGLEWQLRQNPSRMDLVEYSDSEPIVSKPKVKPSITSRAESTLRKRERTITPCNYESSESPRSKLADKKSRLSIDERTYSVASLMDRDWNPLHFLKCHSGDNCADDDKTQVWHCAFEPEIFDKRSHIVATCGGQTVCLIDCETGRIVHRYKHARSSEEFFTLAWTTLKIENTGKSDKKMNVLAVGGKRGMILLLQPNQLVCYAELSGHKDMISGLNFHGEMPQILCSGSTDGTIIVWDIGIPKGTNFEADWKHIHIIKVQYDVLNVLFVPQVDFLLAGTENSCWGWTFDARRPTLMTKMPSVEFVHPTKVSGTVQMESVVDAIVLVSKNIVASKCAGYKCIYLWDISATVLSTIKKLSRGVRLNIQVLAILQWSDNDNFYLNMGCSKESKILACGDASGKLWIYQLQELLANKRDIQKTQQQVVSPVILIDWPECRLKSSNRTPEREVNLNNVVINSVSISSDARYITAVTDKNIVCIWN